MQNAKQRFSGQGATDEYSLPWHLCVVNFHSKGAWSAKGGRGQEICNLLCNCPSDPLRSSFPNPPPPRCPASSHLEALILHLAASGFVAPHVRGSGGPRRGCRLCTLAFNQRSLRVFACLLRRFHPGVRACLPVCV